jgi:hypothetical protein
MEGEEMKVAIRGILLGMVLALLLLAFEEFVLGITLPDSISFFQGCVCGAVCMIISIRMGE